MKFTTAVLAMLMPLATFAGYQVKTNELLFSALEWKDAVGTAAVTNGPWEYLGKAIEPTEPWETEPEAWINPFLSKAPCEPGAPFFYGLWRRGSDGHSLYAIVLKDNDGKHLVSLDGTGVFTLTGLPPDNGGADRVGPYSPDVFKIGENRYRMYFWAFGHYCSLGCWHRYMVAESDDLYHWEVVNDGKPVLVHGADVLNSQGWPKSLSCNDATTVNRLPDGSWEFLSAAFSDGHERMIQRWTSKDGFHLSEPEVIMTRDEEDDPSTEFYYLTAYPLERYTVGFWGDFSGNDEDGMTIKTAWSPDRIHWNRPDRTPLYPGGDVWPTMTTISDIMEEPDGHLTLWYNTSDGNHDNVTPQGTPAIFKTRRARIHRRKFFGRVLESGTTLASPPLRFTGKDLRIYVSPGANLSCRWQTLYSSSVQDVGVSVNGDIAVVDLSGAIASGSLGTLLVSGNGIVYDATTADYSDYEPEVDPCPPGMHTYNSVTNRASCLEEGTATHTCTTCGDTYDETLPALSGHTWDGTSGDGLHCANCSETVEPAPDGGTAPWPVREPFEEYVAGSKLNGCLGWTGDGTVAAGTPDLPKYGHPLPDDEHTKVLSTAAAQTAARHFEAPDATDLKFDLLVRARRSSAADLGKSEDTKFAVAFDEDGQLLVWALDADGDAAWLPTGRVFEENAWVRFQGEWNRTAVAGSEFIRLRANDAAAVNADACVAVSAERQAPLSEPVWFRVAAVDGSAPSVFETSGTALDDLRVMPASDIFASDPRTLMSIQ